MHTWVIWSSMKLLTIPNTWSDAYIKLFSDIEWFSQCSCIIIIAVSRYTPNFIIARHYSGGLYHVRDLEDLRALCRILSELRVLYWALRSSKSRTNWLNSVKYLATMPRGFIHKLHCCACLATNLTIGNSVILYHLHGPIRFQYLLPLYDLSIQIITLIQVTFRLHSWRKVVYWSMHDSKRINALNMYNYSLLITYSGFPFLLTKWGSKCCWRVLKFIAAANSIIIL